MLDVEFILAQMNGGQVDCLLIGGMNYLLNHRPEITYDIDLWVADDPANRAALSQALHALGAEWGPTEQSWRPTPLDPAWLWRQSVYCLTTRHGALDIFFQVKGLEGRYAECKAAAPRRATAGGVPYKSLSDLHMLTCQEALSAAEQKASRVAVLRAAIAASRL